MNFLVSILQIVIASLLVSAILLQQRGAGLGTAFGGEGNIYFKKRGLEKILFIATICLAVLFLGLAFISLLI